MVLHTWLGRHVSLGGGYINPILYSIKVLNTNACQIFCTSPRTLSMSIHKYNKEDILRVRRITDQKNANGEQLFHVVIHSSYPVNICLTWEHLMTDKRILTTIGKTLKLCSDMKFYGVVIHGSGVSREERESGKFTRGDEIVRFAENLNKICRMYATYLKPEGGPYIFIENLPGKNGDLIVNLEDMTQLWAGLTTATKQVVRFVIDTAHCYGSGMLKFNRDVGDVKKFITKWEKEIGPIKNTIGVIHLNDTVEPYNSGKDEHAKINGGGFITRYNYDGLKHFMKIMLKNNVTIILESHIEGDKVDKEEIESFLGWYKK